MTSDASPDGLEVLSGGAGRLEALRALQRVLAVSLLEAPADKRAPLAQQLRAVLSEVDELELPDEGDPVGTLSDEFAARRAAARAVSA